MLSPFRMVCGNFILPEPASYVFFYAFFNLRNLLYIIKNRIEEHIFDNKLRTAAMYNSIIKRIEDEKALNTIDNNVNM